MTAPDLVTRLRAKDARQLQLQIVQPALVGMIDGTISTLAPIFASAYLAGSHAAGAIYPGTVPITEMSPPDLWARSGLRQQS